MQAKQLPHQPYQASFHWPAQNTLMNVLFHEVNRRLNYVNAVRHTHMDGNNFTLTAIANVLQTSITVHYKNNAQQPLTLTASGPNPYHIHLMFEYGHYKAYNLTTGKAEEVMVIPGDCQYDSVLASYNKIPNVTPLTTQQLRKQVGDYLLNDWSLLGLALVPEYY